MFLVNWKTRGRVALGRYSSLCSVFGLWPEEKDDVYLRIRWGISTFCMTVVILTGVYDSYLNCTHIENSSDNLHSVTFGTIGLSKMIFYYKNREKLRANVESAVDDWSSRDATIFKSIMVDCKRTYKKCIILFIGYGGFASVMYAVKVFFIDPDATISVPIVKDGIVANTTTVPKRRFLLPTSCTLNDTSELVYWFVNVVQSILYSTSLAINMWPDAFLLAITSHLCAQFDILKIKFTSFTTLNDVKETRLKFHALIDRHNHLLKLAEYLQSTFSVIILIQIIMNVFILNIAGFNFLVNMKKEQILGAIPSGTIIVYVLVQTLIYSYMGDKLANSGDEIAQAVYASEWYAMPSVSRDIIFVLKRSRSSIGLRAGSFFQMTHSTFTDITKTAFSYMSVVRLIIDNDPTIKP